MESVVVLKAVFVVALAACICVHDMLWCVGYVGHQASVSGDAF